MTKFSKSEATEKCKGRKVELRCWPRVRMQDRTVIQYVWRDPRTFKGYPSSEYNK